MTDESGGPGIGWLVVGGIVVAAVSVGNRLLRGGRAGSGMDDGHDDRYSDSWQRRRRRSALRSSRRRSSGSGGRSRRRSSGGSRRGRGGRRL